MMTTRASVAASARREVLFERLLAHSHATGRLLSTKALAQIGQALATGKIDAEVACCPHCAGRLRVRYHVSDQYAKVVNGWIAEQAMKQAAE
jgi:hypothetical protein